jgi:DnaJ-class molecular chaperone
MTCTCTPCGDCHGSGNVRRPDRHSPDGYELESCEECNGSGITSECDYCHDQRERDEQDEEVC